MAAGGYPQNYTKGETISGLQTITDSNIKVFHAGTRLQDTKVKTSGGRVLCVTALGETIKDAQTNAYEAVKKISWKDAYYRNDIGYRAIN